MKKITWVQIDSGKYGGRMYGSQVRKALADDFSVELVSIRATLFLQKYLKPLEWFFRLLCVKNKSDLCIRDDFNTIAASFFTKPAGKDIALIYHIDFSIFPPLLGGIFYVLEKFFYAKLKKIESIFVISEYWKNYFLEKGFKNVQKIYCGFDMEEFLIEDRAVEEFKKKFGLEGKPIVYIGNCQKAKGVVGAYESLKSLDVHIVTSGEKRVNIPAINISASREDYLCLLKASSVALTMSQFNEGWCMTAHEAMLCKTPVIGSGKGGMKELLDGGRQVVCADFNGLKEKVEYILHHSAVAKKMGDDGFAYARQFTREKFKGNWQEAIQKLLC